jgi:hypothetical protein
MNAPFGQGGPSTGKAGAPWWPWALAGLVVCLLAVSGDSVWIDEALTAQEAAHETPGGMWQMVLHDKGSDLQMPLYIFYMWSWVKMFGAGEWALRAANIPWFVAAIAIFTGAFVGPRRWAMGLVTLCCPFAWYYLNEARPYAIQLSASMIVFAALYRLSQSSELTAGQERAWVLAFLLGMICLCGSSLLGMIWAGAALLGAWFLVPWKRIAELTRAYPLGVVLSFGLLAVMGVYYLWSLKIGARATGGKTDAKNLIFIGYELFGFGGLGPGRLEIRDNGPAVFLPYVKELALYAGMVVFVCVLGIGRIYRGPSRRTALYLSAGITIPMLVLLGAGCLLHFRVLERHFTPLLPVLVFVLGLGLTAAWSGRPRISKLLACGFVVLSIASCLEVRFAARHKKDDYRDAAAIANEALRNGQVVWWNAGPHGAAYYHLPLSSDPDLRNHAVWLLNPTAGTLSSLPPPELIIASKPDLFDDQGVVAEYVRKTPYVKLASFPAFMLWQRKADKVERRDGLQTGNLIE